MIGRSKQLGNWVQFGQLANARIELVWMFGKYYSAFLMPQTEKHRYSNSMVTGHAQGVGLQFELDYDTEVFRLLVRKLWRESVHAQKFQFKIPPKACTPENLCKIQKNTISVAERPCPSHWIHTQLRVCKPWLSSASLFSMEAISKRTSFIFASCNCNGPLITRTKLIWTCKLWKHGLFKPIVSLTYSGTSLIGTYKGTSLIRTSKDTIHCTVEPLSKGSGTP